MLGRTLPLQSLARVMRAIRKEPFQPTPDLDALAETAPRQQASTLSYDHGYLLAGWLRGKLGLATDQAADPETIPADWGVVMRELDLGSRLIDAVSLWSSQHGPVILVNPVGEHSQGLKGRRATLAHEICHLLVDREGALPVAEVLGGMVPKDVEARAKAFAAELLLPRAIAGQALAQAQQPENVTKRLARIYGVSFEIVAWQARNAGVLLSDGVRSYLKSLVREPERF